MASKGYWPTPRVPNGGQGLPADAVLTSKTAAYTPDGKKLTVSLPAAVKMWPTPRAQDSKHAAATPYELSRAPVVDLLHVRVARAQMWPTPRATDGTRGEAGLWELQRKPKQDRLNVRVAREQIWPTPTATDATKGGPNQRYSSGGTALTASVCKTGQVLNPAWVELLMGFPLGWTRIPGEKDGKTAHLAQS
jgi:hypothetical protein